MSHPTRAAPRGSARGVAAVLVAVLLGAGAGADAATPSAGTTAPPTAPVDLGVVAGPVRLLAGDTPVALDGRRYVGTLEARAGAAGLTLVDALPLDAYLQGLAEVPVSWPAEALRAQVVAARTYAWWELRQGVWADRGYDICATQACQVFAGRDLVEADDAGRWAAAVASTTGEVLLDPDGAPILARYSSSNGGRSRANEDVFPDDGAFPWLRAVPDPLDAVSPLHRWRVRFPRADLDALLARGEVLAAATPVADVRLVAVDGGEDLVAVTGVDGTVARVTAPAFRRFVTAVAPEIDPGAYPPPLPGDPSRRMPATLPSDQLAFDVTAEAVVVRGRGFGHGVGMSQYGARGRAEAGAGYDEILAAYYGGIVPRVAPDVPRRVRVGLAEGREAATFVPTGPVVVRAGDTVLTRRGLGAWRVEAEGDGTLRVLAPPGYGAPLVVDTTRAEPTTAPAGLAVRLATVVNKPVELELVVRDAAGALVERRRLGVVGAGRQELAWRGAAVDGGLLTPGAYDVRLVGRDEDGTRRGSPARVTLTAASTGGGGDAGGAPGAGTAGQPPLLLLSAGTLVAGGVLALVEARRRRRGRA